MVKDNGWEGSDEKRKSISWGSWLFEFELPRYRLMSWHPTVHIEHVNCTPSFLPSRGSEFCFELPNSTTCFLHAFIQTFLHIYSCLSHSTNHQFIVSIHTLDLTFLFPKTSLISLVFFSIPGFWFPFVLLLRLVEPRLFLLSFAFILSTG